jgi:hypothetical protein
VLVLVTQAAAAANGERHASASRGAGKAERALALKAKLALKLEAARKHRNTIRFFRTHRRLLHLGEQRATSRLALRRAERGLERTTKEIAYYRRLLRLREDRLRARRLKAASPRVAICRAFGRYCEQAVSVAYCESRLSTRARNGQYLGLFQMGANERRLFGHGDTAHEQAVAAHKYFVSSGRDWSPWGCRWAAF